MASIQQVSMEEKTLKDAINELLNDQNKRVKGELYSLEYDLQLIDSYVNYVKNCSLTFRSLPHDSTKENRKKSHQQLMKACAELHYALCLVKESCYDGDVEAYYILVKVAHREAGPDFVDGLRCPWFHSILRNDPTHLPLYTSVKYME
jgi:hypothetical protein